MTLPPAKASCGHPLAYTYWQGGKINCERCKRFEAVEKLSIALDWYETERAAHSATATVLLAMMRVRMDESR